MTRLSPLTFLVCGVVLILVIWAGFYFLSIDRTIKEIESYQEYHAKLREVVSEKSQKDAQIRVRQALETVEKAEQEWKLIAERKTPAASRINLTTHRWQTTVDARQWHAQVERDLRDWILRSGVRIVASTPQDVADGGRRLATMVYANAGGAGVMDRIYERDRNYWEERFRMLHNIPHDEIRVPYPTDLANELVQFYFNYPALPFPVAFLPAGTIVVEGTYEQVVAHVRSWNDIPGYIASVRGLAISGTGTRLRGTYDLLIVAYINTENVFGGSPQAPYRIPDISSGQQGAGQASGTQERPTRPGAGPAGGGGAVGGAGGGPAPAAGGRDRQGPTPAAAS